MTRKTSAQAPILRVVILIIAALTLLVAIAALIGAQSSPAARADQPNVLPIAQEPYPGVPPNPPQMLRQAPFAQGGSRAVEAAAPLSGASEASGQHFARAVTYPSGGGEGANSVVIGDVNGDGKPDLVVANQGAVGPCCGMGTVGVLLGNGDGTFQAAASYSSGGYVANSVAIGDVNGDGKPDLVVANHCAEYTCTLNGTVGVLLGNGDGTFQTAVTYGSGGWEASSVAAADLTGNGILDVVVANWCVNSSSCNNGTVGVLLGNGDGTFQTVVAYGTGGIEAYSVAVADVNGDGKPDLVVANLCGNSSNCDNGGVAVLLGNGDGTFQTAVAYGSGPFRAHSVAVADVNGDGKPDLLVANWCVNSSSCNNGTVGVLLGNGDGTFQTAVTYGTGGPGAASVAVADVNGDGKPDLVVANWCVSSSNCEKTGPVDGTVGVLLGNGDGTFQTAVTYGSGGLSAGSVAVADLTGNGKPDLAVANGSAPRKIGGGSVGILLNKLMASTAAVVTSSPNPSLVGQTVAFTATITSNPPVPNGELVTFYSNNVEIGTGATTNGVATLSTVFSKAKTQTIYAKYPGDLFHRAVSRSIKQVVNAAATTTTLTSSLNPSTYGQAATWTATVTTAGPNQPTGKVKFVGVGGAATLSGGVATFSKTWLNAATYSITAEYEGDDANAPSTSSVLNQVVNPASTTTTVASSANPSSQGQNVTLTATVTTSTGVNSAGTVTFTAGGTTLGTATLSSNVASVSTATLPVGTTVVQATYNGETNFTGSGGSLTQVVNQ